ncbi:hypothetical protein BDV11DRAFT_188650 [Aspergillus similis]
MSNIRALGTFNSIFDLDVCSANMICMFPIFIHPSIGFFRTDLATQPFTVAIHYICAAGPWRLVENSGF